MQFVSTDLKNFKIPSSDHEALQDYCLYELGGKPMSRFLRGLIRRSVPELREKYARLAAAKRSSTKTKKNRRK